MVFQVATCRAFCRSSSFWNQKACGAKEIDTNGDVPQEVLDIMATLLEKNRDGCDKKMVGGHIFLIRVKYHRLSDNYLVRSVRITKGGVQVYYSEEKICK